MKYKHILVITYGRTGSTLLQGLLNDIDNCIVRGENYNYCYGIFNSYQSLCEIQASQLNNGGDETKPFFGSNLFNIDLFLSEQRNILESQLQVNGIGCWGFKEIRYTPSALTDKKQYQLKKYLSFLERLLPDTAFIFLTRDIAEVLDSAFWKEKDKTVAVNDILKFEQQSKEWMLVDRGNSYLIDYSNIVSIDAVLEGMYEFLGVEFNKTRVKQLLKIEHSYGGKKENLTSTTGNVEKNLFLKTIKPCLVEFVELSFLDIKDNFMVIEKDSTYTLGGVVLLKSSYPQSDFSLEIKTNNGFKPVEWGISSEMVSNKHPENPNASHARFIVKDVDMSGLEEFFLSIRNQAGESFVLFKFLPKFISPLTNYID